MRDLPVFGALGSNDRERPTRDIQRIAERCSAAFAYLPFDTRCSIIGGAMTESRDVAAIGAMSALRNWPNGLLEIANLEMV